MRSAPANAALPGGRLEEQQWVVSTDILVERSIVHFHGQFDRMCQIVNVAVRPKADIRWMDVGTYVRISQIGLVPR